MSQKMASFAQLFELLAAIVRQFGKIGEKIPAERAQRLIENQVELGSALLPALLGTPFQSLLVACRQNWVSPDFNETNFPLEPVAPDEADWEVVEHHFDRTMTGKEAFVELQQLGYRLLGGSRRGLEFLAANPGLQNDHPLVITARWRHQDGNWFVPITKRYELDLCYYLASCFAPHYGWLVLRKRAA
jgi:hypothetical protein